MSWGIVKPQVPIWLNARFNTLQIVHGQLLIVGKGSHPGRIVNAYTETAS